MPEPKTEEAQFRPGTVVRYEPDPARHSPRWCREGTAIADDNGVSGQHIVTAAEMPSVAVLFHLDDYDELDRWRPDVQRWMTYAPEDRQRVTSQHGHDQRLFIRKGAQPDLATQIANAEEKVREAERAVESAEFRLEWARNDLAALSGNSTPPGAVDRG